MASETIELIRRMGREGVKRLEYQKFGDSPTVKYYTKWDLYSKYLEDPGICTSVGLIVKSDVEKVGIWKFSSHEDLYPIGKLIRPDESKIAASHYVALRDALVVEIRDNTDVEIRVGDGLGSSSIHSRHIILVTKKRIKANVTIDATNYENDALETLFIEGYLGKKSKLNLLILNNPPENTPSINIFRFALDDGADLKYGYLGSGGYMHHQNDLFLLGERAKVISGAAFVSGPKQKIDYVGSVVHEGPRGESHITSQGVIFGDGYGVARGLARVTRSGDWSKTVFEAGVILMDEGGKGYASPMLEINTGNVLEARHEAREARFGLEQLFYLATRGFNKDEARYLLTYGILLNQVSHLDGELLEYADGFIRDMFFK